MTNTETAETAAIIRSQIANPTFWALGATDLGHTTTDRGYPAFIFVARIIPTGKSAARKMVVQVEYLPSDTYEIAVWYIDRAGNKIIHYQATDIYAEDLNRTLYRLDREG